MGDDTRRESLDASHLRQPGQLHRDTEPATADDAPDGELSVLADLPRHLDLVG